MLFDGTTGYVTAGSAAALGVTGAYTIEAWIKTATVTSRQYIVGRRYNNSVGIGASLRVEPTSGVLYADLYTSGGVAIFFVAGVSSVADGAWHHVLVTWDGTTTASGVKLYVDTALVAQATASAGTPGASNDFLIGAAAGATGAPNGFFNGAIDESVVFNRALTAAEISAIYNATK